MGFIKTIFFFFLVTQVYPAYRISRIISKDKSIKVLRYKKLSKKLDKRITLRRIREYILESAETPKNIFEDILIPNREKVHFKDFKSTHRSSNSHFLGSETREILKQGPNNNRIILTFLGDGYLLSEKEKYFSDVQRLVKDLIERETFKSYRKLFNIYATFTPSRQSGISDRVYKDTVFGLYRYPKGSKRGILPGNKDVIEEVLDTLPFFTDYPIIVANDDYYGGLGGRYAITTRSLSSGSMVLRHELGHNFSNVGEEYDGGQVYMGANFSSTPQVGWGHWIEGNIKLNRSKFLSGSYLWQNLTNHDYRKKFTLEGDKTHLYSINISSVGWESKNDVVLFLNGRPLNLQGRFTSDRSFFTTKKINLNPGDHLLEIVDKSRDGDNVLAFANGKAYPDSYNFKKGQIGAFNIFDSKGKEKGFRPTHNDCLMRDMRLLNFCPVDQENIWFRFFRKLNLIENINVKKEEIIITLMDLKGIQLSWFYRPRFGGENEILDLNGKLIVKKEKLKKGPYLLRAKWKNPEIKKAFIVTEKEFKL